MLTFEQFTAKSTESMHIISIVKSALSLEKAIEALVDQAEKKSIMLATKTTEVINLREENERLRNVIKHLEDMVLSVPQ